MILSLVYSFVPAFHCSTRYHGKTDLILVISWSWEGNVFLAQLQDVRFNWVINVKANWFLVLPSLLLVLLYWRAIPEKTDPIINIVISVWGRGPAAAALPPTLITKLMLMCGARHVCSRARNTLPSQLQDITRIRSVLPWYLVLQWNAGTKE